MAAVGNGHRRECDMPDHLPVGFRNQRKSERTCVTQGIDDELFIVRCKRLRAESSFSQAEDSFHIGRLFWTNDHDLYPTWEAKRAVLSKPRQA